MPGRPAGAGTSGHGDRPRLGGPHCWASARPELLDEGAHDGGHVDAPVQELLALEPLDEAGQVRRRQIEVKVRPQAPGRPLGDQFLVNFVVISAGIANIQIVYFPVVTMPVFLDLFGAAEKAFFVFKGFNLA